MMLSSSAVDRVLGIGLATTARLIALGLLEFRPPRMRPQGVYHGPRRWKGSVIGDTAGEKKRVARRSTGLDYSCL
jgi:hypothetical protein